MNISSAAEVTLSFPFLWRSSWETVFIVLDGFCDCTWRNFKSSWNVPYWLTFMSWQSIITLFLFAYLSCSCHNMDLVFYQIGLSSVYPPYLITTQPIGSNTVTFKKPHLLIEMHSRWLLHEVGWENAKCAQSWCRCYVVCHCEDGELSILSPCSAVLGVSQYGHCNLLPWPHLQHA
jgi:hypothetical protein